MNSLTLKNTSKAVAWIMAVSMAFAFSVPSASAFVSRGHSSTAKWVAQTPGAASGGSTVINAEGGDVLDFSLTIQNTSATDVFYSADALLDEPAPYVGAHEFRVGATNDTVYSNIFDFSDANFVNNNRFATFQSGPAVFPGQNLTFSWSMEVKNDISDGTYRFAVGVVQEYDAWLGDQPGAGAGGPMNNLGGRSGGTIFWDIVIGEGSQAPSGDLEGGAGDITVKGLSTYSDEEVGEGDDDVKVAAFEVEADNESDVEITSLRVELHQEEGASSRDLDDYATEVSIWMNGDMVGSADVDEFTENNDIWSKSISLSDAIIRMGDTEEFVIAISAVNNLDSGDIDADDWHVAVASIRFIDGDGVVTTLPLTSVGTDNTINNGDGEVEQQFSFEDFGTANDVELRAQLSDDNPDEQVVIGESATTTDVLMLVFELEAEGSDINVDELEFDITSNGADTDEVATKLMLKWGSNTRSEAIPDAGATTDDILFDDLDIDIDEDDAEEFEVWATIKRVNDTPLTNGDTFKVDLDVSETAAEDEVGDDVTDLSGTANGEIQHIFTAAPVISNVSTSAQYVGDAKDTITATIAFDVTAKGGQLFFNGDDEGTAADEAFIPAVLGGNGNTDLDAYTTTVTGYSAVTNGGADNEYFTLNEDAKMRVTVTFSISQDTDTSLAGAQITEIQFGTVVTDQTTRSANSMTWADLLDQLETNRVTLIGA